MVNFETKRSCMPLVLVVIFRCKLKLIEPPFILDILLYSMVFPRNLSWHYLSSNISLLSAHEIKIYIHLYNICPNKFCWQKHVFLDSVLGVTSFCKFELMLLILCDDRQPSVANGCVVRSSS